MYVYVYVCVYVCGWLLLVVPAHLVCRPTLSHSFLPLPSPFHPRPLACCVVLGHRMPGASQWMQTKEGSPLVTTLAVPFLLSCVYVRLSSQIALVHPVVLVLLLGGWWSCA